MSGYNPGGLFQPLQISGSIIRLAAVFSDLLRLKTTLDPVVKGRMEGEKKKKPLG